MKPPCKRKAAPRGRSPSNSSSDEGCKSKCRKKTETSAPALRLHIFSSYRPMNMDWKCCLKSIFQLHNDTISIWMLIVAYVYLTYQFFDVYRYIDMNKKPQQWIMLAYLFCIRMWTIFNLVYQIFFVMSKNVANTLDVLCLWSYSIRIICFAGAVSTYMLPSEIKTPELVQWNMILWNILSILLLMAGCTKRFDKISARSRLYILYAIGLLASLSVVLCNFLYHSMIQESSLYLFSTFLAIQTIGNVILATRWPESFRPGKFDVMGNSRQLFLFFSILSAVISHEGFKIASGLLEPASLTIIDSIYEFFFGAPDYWAAIEAVKTCCIDIVMSIGLSIIINTLFIIIWFIMCILSGANAAKDCS